MNTPMAPDLVALLRCVHCGARLVDHGGPCENDHAARVHPGRWVDASVGVKAAVRNLVVARRP